MNVAEHFSQSYAEARDRFLAAARARAAAISRHIHPTERGARGEELSIDVARLGPDRARTLFMLTSATHGVEGFCGSGCQTALLHDAAFLTAIARSGVAVVMVHAVNPYGFSHLRRANESNVDLNRNFLDFDAPRPVNAAYTDIHSWLLPPTWPPSADNEAKLGAWIARHGVKAYQTAVSGGQYAYPDGMFYGGNKPEWSNGCLHAVFREHACECSRLGWIDFHTGLGPRGHGEKIYNGRNDAAEIARTRDWWGDDVTAYQDGTSSSAPLTGIIGTAAYEECPGTELASIALEYGTYPIQDVLEAFRAEHWAHNHPEAPEAQRREIKRHLKDIFYIDAEDWKTMVYGQALDACLKALARLGNP